MEHVRFRSETSTGLLGGDVGSFLEADGLTGIVMIDTFGCIRNTIKVSAGHYVDLASPDPETIDIRSIASALSKICRFGGHCPRFYTVAEHCVHAVGLAMQDEATEDVLRAILLHDATEAYVGDVVKPLKAMLPEYQVVESNIEQAISTRFNVDFVRYQPVIKRYDRFMLKAEKIQMWPEDREEWFGFAGLEHRSVAFKFWSPPLAEEKFLTMAGILGL